jgi:hypothetical protein
MEKKPSQSKSDQRKITNSSSSDSSKPRGSTANGSYGQVLPATGIRYWQNPGRAYNDTELHPEHHLDRSVS